MKLISNDKGGKHTTAGSKVTETRKYFKIKQVNKDDLNQRKTYRREQSET